jgi:hypothetical protein
MVADLEVANLLHLRAPEAFSGVRTPALLGEPSKQLWLLTVLATAAEAVAVQPATGRRRIRLTDAQQQELHNAYMYIDGDYGDLWKNFTRDYYFDFVSA